MSQSSAAPPSRAGLHIVPLSYAWSAGAWQWTPERREQFANDRARCLDPAGSVSAGRVMAGDACGRMFTA
jgi:hypothetical protein